MENVENNFSIANILCSNASRVNNSPFQSNKLVSDFFNEDKIHNINASGSIENNLNECIDNILDIGPFSRSNILDIKLKDNVIPHLKKLLKMK